MQRKGWLIILVVGVLALSAWSARTYLARDRRSESGVEARLASLEAALVRLEARTIAAEHAARLQAARSFAPAAPAPADMARVAAAAQDDVPGAEHEPAADIDADSPPQPSLEERLEEAFAAEAPDSEWTEAAPRRIVAAFSSTLPSGSRIRDVDCRGSLCRVEISHAVEGAHAELLGALTRTPGIWKGPGSVSQIADAIGTPTTLAFLGQPGTDFTPGSIWQ